MIEPNKTPSGFDAPIANPDYEPGSASGSVHMGNVGLRYWQQFLSGLVYAV
jgi:hypothetical protein